jgi:hypothetical protein
MERREAVNRPIIPTTPGAFAIPGANSTTATVLHVVDIIQEQVQEEEEDEEDEWNELDRILDVDEEEWNCLDKPNELKNQTAESNLIGQPFWLWIERLALISQKVITFDPALLAEDADVMGISVDGKDF